VEERMKIEKLDDCVPCDDVHKKINELIDIVNGIIHSAPGVKPVESKTLEDVIMKWDEGKGCLMDYDLKNLTSAIKDYLRGKIEKKRRFMHPEANTESMTYEKMISFNEALDDLLKEIS
jgi:hypothetical protein